jgi:CxxC motif-containing protein (DUF1111 family)
LYMIDRIIKPMSFLCFAFALFSCEQFEPKAISQDRLLDGPLEGLTESERVIFKRGDMAFNDVIFTSQSGLGPLFVANSCGSCHPGDGKGHPFTTLTRFGQNDGSGNHYLSAGGPQLQNRAIPGFQPEQLPSGVGFTRLTPPANTGLGFIDAVTDEHILEWADPNDIDGDGISGVANWISMKKYISPRPNSIEKEERYVGRFGKKASAYNLHQQTAQAYNEDIGISSTYEAHDTHSGLQVDPEITDKTVEDVVNYLKTLKAPIQRDANKEEVVSGKQLFIQIDCGKCHRPEMRTGDSPIAALSNKPFYPYSDLLLHDMGPGLDDGYTEGTALTSEWRTPPLWGLGLSKNSQGGEYFLLHDGRARSIEEAIRLHGGEALRSKNNYETLSEPDRKKVLTFLESL